MIQLLTQAALTSYDADRLPRLRRFADYFSRPYLPFHHQT